MTCYNTFKCQDGLAHYTYSNLMSNGARITYPATACTASLPFGQKIDFQSYVKVQQAGSKLRNMVYLLSFSALVLDFQCNIIRLLDVLACVVSLLLIYEMVYELHIEVQQEGTSVENKACYLTEACRPSVSQQA